MKVFRILYCGFLEKGSFAGSRNKMSTIVGFCSVVVFFFFPSFRHSFFLLNVYVFLRERERGHEPSKGGGAEREGDRI